MEEVQIQGYRLSPQQRRLWAFLAPDSAMSAPYLAWALVEIQGRFDGKTLEAAASRLTRGLEILRTRFRRPPGLKEAYQVIERERSDELELFAESFDDEAWVRRSQIVQQRLSTLRQLAWDPGGGPCLRLHLLTFGSEANLLLLMAPALCCDATSLRLLSRALLAEAASSAGRSETAEPLQYADVAEWLNELLESEDAALGREFWSDGRLMGLTDVTLGATRRQRGEAAEFDLQERSFLVEEDQRRNLEILARDFDTELSFLLAGCWQILLWRLADQETPTLALEVDGRRYDELAEVIGPLSRNLPLRLHLKSDQSLRHAVQKLEAAFREVEPWQEALDLRDRGLGRSHGELSYPYIFSFDLEPDGEAAGRWMWRTLEADAIYESFHLRLAVRGGNHGPLTVRVQADSKRFSVQQAERLAEHLRVLIESAPGSGDHTIDQLSILSRQERRQVLNFGQGSKDFQEDVPVHELFRQQTLKTPGAPAIRCGEEQVTYEELKQRVVRLSRRLRQRGVTTETVVAVGTRRSPETLVAILSVLRAGGAYLPLDPVYPWERLKFMVEDAGASILLASSSVLEQMRPLVPLCLSVEEEVQAELKEEAQGEVEGTAEVLPANLAYLIYTSGSTGQPKGVAVTHHGLSRSTRARLAAYERPPGRFLLLPSFAFDSSVAGLFWTLTSGGTIVLPEVDPQRDPERLAALIAQAGVTHLLALPSLYSLILSTGATGQLESLEGVIVAGETCPQDLVERHVQRCPRVPLFNEYGPTEATVWSSVAQLYDGGSGRLEGSPDGPVPIGRPIPGSRLLVLDRHLEPVPLEVAGQLWIGGVSLARGYLGRPSLTADRFRPDPTGGVGERLYRTGDLAQWRHDGQLDFLGRRDHQFKVRGFRIEAGEVEAVLAAHPGVREAVVTVYGETAEDRRLAAYLSVSEARAPFTDDEFRHFLAQRLPEFMIPATFMVLDPLPRLPNGKVDRGSLPAPEKASRRRAYLAPRTPAEEMIAGLWGDVLQVERVGADDSFFDLGGHSLLATRVISRLREAFHVELTLPDLFAAPTVTAMASRIAAVQHRDQGVLAPPLTPTQRQGPIPLSFAQQRLWFLEQLEPGSAYVVPTAIHLQGRLDIAVLDRVLREITRRHEVLRTTFREVDGLPVQEVKEWVDMAPRLIDLKQLSASVRRAIQEELTLRNTARPFDLARGPMLRVTLLRLSLTEYVALITNHHIISDLWSVGIFVRELTTLYRSIAAGDASPLPELPVQYGDFAQWQRGWLQGDVLGGHLSFWLQHLAGVPTLELPVDRPLPARRSYAGAAISFSLPPETVAGLNVIRRQAGATLFMTLLTGYKTLLSRYSAQQDISVGTVVAGRDRVEIEPLIGCFVNTLVLRTNLAGDPPFQGALDRVRRTALEAYAHQDLPFEQLIEALQPERDLRRSPLFQTVFLLQNVAEEQLELGNLELRTFDVDRGVTLFDTTLLMQETGGKLQGILEYSRELFDDVTAQRMVEHLCRLFVGVAAAPGQRLSELPLLSAQEKHQLLHEWGPSREVSESCIDGSLTLHEAFARQARRNPQAIAVDSGDRKLTYGELDAQAESLAIQLAAAGCLPGNVIALCFERGFELVIAILAVLKAGGTYLPIEPSTPVERVDFLLRDSRVRLVLAEEAVRDSLPAASPPSLFLEELERKAAPADVDWRRPVTDRELPAYVIYTSGSTGLPKGVVVSHANVLRLFQQTESWFRFSSQDVWSLFHSYAFDFAVWELWGALLYGGRAVIIPRSVTRSPDAFLDLLRERGVTVLNQTPSAFYALMQTAEEAEKKAPEALRWIIFGGEAFEPSRFRRWIELQGDKEPGLVNMYGITETTVHVTLRRIWKRDIVDGVGSPIGQPIGDLQVRVLDPHLRPIPVGLGGELCVGGAGLSRGYLGRPRLTAERFVPDPFTDEPGVRLYRSGDQARYRRDGELEYLGRLDQQLKIRGFRIEPGEIEATLAEHPAVRDVVVLARRTSLGAEEGGAILLAYVVTLEPHPEIEELSSFLRKRLPEYMVPSNFVFLDALPLTANGKIDRAALPLPDGERPRQEHAYLAPRTETEQTLAGIWAEVLRLDKVGIHDDFFSLGGHSLLATQVNARIRRLLGVTLPLRQLFEHTTVARLAAVVEEGQAGGETMSKIQAVLDRLEHLSEEEASRLLESSELQDVGGLG